MKSTKSLVKYLYLALALIFGIQTISSKVVIDLNTVLYILSLPKDIIGVFSAIFYTAGIFWLGTWIILLLARNRAIDQSYQHSVFSSLATEYVRAFVTFFLAWILYIVINHDAALFEQNADITLFLNSYLFWYFLIRAFSAPEAISEKAQ